MLANENKTLHIQVKMQIKTNTKKDTHVEFNFE